MMLLCGHADSALWSPNAVLNSQLPNTCYDSTLREYLAYFPCLKLPVYFQRYSVPPQNGFVDHRITQAVETV